MKNSDFGSPQIKAKKRRLFFIRFYIVLFLFVTVVLSLAILSGHEKVKIKEITVQGNAAVSSDNILSVVNKNLGGRYWYLFSRANFLIFPRWAIERDLKNNFKTIKEVDIDWMGWQRLSIIITERKPQAVWCGISWSENLLTFDSQLNSLCYFMDQDGYIYNSAPVFSGNIFIKNYGPLAVADPLGQYFLPTEKYRQIFNLIRFLELMTINVIAVSYDGRDFTFILDNGLKILFNDKQKFELSFDNLLTASKTGNLDLTNPAKDIDYLDLRFDNRIIIGKKP